MDSDGRGCMMYRRQSLKRTLTFGWRLERFRSSHIGRCNVRPKDLASPEPTVHHEGEVPTHSPTGRIRKGGSGGL